jgi:hypothetical protein
MVLIVVVHKMVAKPDDGDIVKQKGKEKEKKRYGSSIIIIL